MTHVGMSLPRNLGSNELVSLAATLDCALMGEGDGCDTAQMDAVAWVNHLSGPKDFHGDAMLDAIWALWALVGAEMRHRTHADERVQDDEDDWLSCGMDLLCQGFDEDAQDVFMAATLH